MGSKIQHGASIGSEKQCTKCGLSKPVAAYTKDKYTPDGLNRRCGTCVNAQSKAYHDANKDKLLAMNKAWRATHVGDIAERKRNKYLADREWCVYRIDTADNKIYIGSTGHAERRRITHKHGITHNTHRNKFLRGYTPDALTFSVVAVYPDMPTARIAERELIEHVRETVGERCLNISVPQIGTAKYHPGTVGAKG